jgi:hypothetical protein
MHDEIKTWRARMTLHMTVIIILDGVHKTTRKPHELALGAQSRVHQSFIHVSRVN